MFYLCATGWVGAQFHRMVYEKRIIEPQKIKLWNKLSFVQNKTGIMQNVSRIQ
jgi:hypothetical protein